ncbi:hypothetical protein BDR22DRAFT_241508 [Usnea florida]
MVATLRLLLQYINGNRDPVDPPQLHAKPAPNPNSATLQAGPLIHSQPSSTIWQTNISRIDPFDRPVDTLYTMAEDQANSPQPTQHSADNTEIMALLTRMAEKMDTPIAQMDAIVSPILATQQSTPPAPQEARKEEEETRPQLLYQATVEDDAESTEEKQTEHQYGSSKLSSNKPDSQITLSTILRLCTTSEDSAASLSNALLLGCQHTTFLASHFSYIRCMEGMEASGQG